MTTLDDAKAALAAAQSTVRAAQKVVDDLSPPASTPGPSGMLWGYTMSVNLTSSTRLREFQDGMAVGANCPRLDGNTANANLARQVGFKHWTAIIGRITTMPDLNALATQVISYATTYPEAMIELGNELNFTTLTPEQVAQIHLAVYPKLKAASPTTIMLLSGVGNGPSSNGALSPLAWCTRLASAGCVPGKGFDWFSAHAYSTEPESYDNWMHVWTPDSSGASCLSVFGNPPWLLTEFGKSSDGSSAANQAQALAVGAYMAKLKTLPNCKGGMVYSLSDDAPGSGPHPPHYGLRAMDLSPKPAWDVFHREATR